MHSPLLQPSLRETIREIAVDAQAFFDAVSKTDFKAEEEIPFMLSVYVAAEHYWNQLTPELQQTADTLTGRTLSTCASLAESARASALAGPEDVRDVKVAAKTMRAALHLRSYQYAEADVIHDEGTVLGLRPASQSEGSGLTPENAAAEFKTCIQTLGAVLRLVEASSQDLPVATLATSVPPAKYRAGTAFIMMWMDPKHPELTDVADTVRSVFRSFEVRAVRADDIEHEGLITDRVLNEIRSAEFLFADLSGMRPNVYYEIGYAHALGKRVILFRKSGTGVHFDLAGYNCPEYENLRDLKEKLSRRLISLTNRNPLGEKEI